MDKMGEGGDKENDIRTIPVLMYFNFPASSQAEKPRLAYKKYIKCLKNLIADRITLSLQPISWLSISVWAKSRSLWKNAHLLQSTTADNMKICMY